MINELIASHYDEDVEDLLDSVMKDITDFRAACEELLPLAIANYISNYRAESRISATIKQPNRSYVQTAMTWPQQLRKILVSVHGAYKSLADCTVDDLVYLSKDRTSRADGYLREAARYDKLAQALETQKLDTVAELDDSLTEQIWTN